MRSFFYISSIILIALAVILYQFWHGAIYLSAIIIPYIAVGVYDIFAKKHTILRNYPVFGHFRYLLESVRPEIQQYFIESAHSGTPYSHEVRSLIYQRAKGVKDTIPFGTKHDITQKGYVHSYHSLFPTELSHGEARVIIGGDDCSKKYNSSRLNISAMSFGSLSPNAILALNKGAKLGGFAHNTGEGGLSPYHAEGGGDIIFQIGTGYFGCRNLDGSFSRDKFKDIATQNNVVMVEIKLSQGAKPAHGGILPAAKVNEEIAEIRGIEIGKSAISPPTHAEFSSHEEMLEFIKELRDLSGGKPVGLKLCIGIKQEFIDLCNVMTKANIYPDFITIDGAEGGTGAAPVEFSNRLGTPINEAIPFVNDCLIALKIRDKIKLVASGKVATGYDMITKIALGADICNSARAMMFALGCVQSLSCNTNKCPTGIATQDKKRWKPLDVEDKYQRVANYHKATIENFLELAEAMGITKIDDLSPEHIKHG